MLWGNPSSLRQLVTMNSGVVRRGRPEPGSVAPGTERAS